MAENLLVWLESQTSRSNNKRVLSTFKFGPLLQGQTRIAKLKSAYNSLIIGPRGLRW